MVYGFEISVCHMCTYIVHNARIYEIQISNYNITRTHPKITRLTKQIQLATEKSREQNGRNRNRDSYERH